LGFWIGFGWETQNQKKNENPKKMFFLNFGYGIRFFGFVFGFGYFEFNFELDSLKIEIWTIFFDDVLLFINELKSKKEVKIFHINQTYTF
jgi:hypothetical protein